MLDIENILTEEKISREVATGRELLHNILPPSIANQLARDPTASTARFFPSVTIMQSDIVGFTKLSSALNARDVVAMLNIMFTEFDNLSKAYDVEKICTIGDAYVACAGAPLPHENHPTSIAALAVGMLEAVKAYGAEHGPPVPGGSPLALRIGMHTGGVVAGVMGGSFRFKYDLYGEAFHDAEMLEQSGNVGQVHLAVATAKQILFDTLRPPQKFIVRKGSVSLRYDGEKVRH